MNFAQAFNNMFSGGEGNNQQQGNPGNNQQQTPPGMGGNNDPMNGNNGGGNLTNPNINAGGNNPQPGNNNNQNNGKPGDNNPGGNATGVDYTKLFDNTPAVGADGKPIPEPDNSYLPKIDPNKINESFSKINFAGNITPEQRAAMAQGGEAGVNAMMEVINNVGQQVASRMFHTNYGLLEKALPNAFDKFSGSLDSRINLNMAGNLGRSQNPIMADPQFSPMVDSIRTQISTKYPHLSADNLNSAVNKYFDDMATKLGYKKEAAPAGNNQNQNTGKKATGGASEANWDEWINTSLNQPNP